MARQRHGTLSRTRGREVTDLRRAVIELAIIRGWYVLPTAPRAFDAVLPGLVSAPRLLAGSMISWPDLTFIRAQDRRVVFAALTADGTANLSPPKRLVMDLLSSLRWSADEQRQAERALGRPVPCVEAFVWRPADLIAGTIDEVLR